MMRVTLKLPQQRGQAMVEMAIIAGFLVIVFLSIFYLGKFHDIQSTTIQAARYTAWERTVRPASYSDTKLRDQTRARFFTWNDKAFTTADAKKNGAAWGTQNALWYDHASVQKRLVNKPDDILVRTTNSSLSGSAGKLITETMSKLSSGLSAITGGEKLPTGGLYTGSISVKLANVAALPAPMNALNLTLKENSTVLGDGWESSGPEQVAKRTAAYTPAAALKKVEFLLKPIKFIVSPFEPDFIEFKPGQICPDIVPSDRLSGSADRTAYGGAKCY